MYGPVRTVVWQGSAGDCRPYADQTGLPDMLLTLRSFRGAKAPRFHRSAFMRLEGFKYRRFYSTRDQLALGSENSIFVFAEDVADADDGGDLFGTEAGE